MSFLHFVCLPNVRELLTGWRGIEFAWEESCGGRNTADDFPLLRAFAPFEKLATS